MIPSIPVLLRNCLIIVVSIFLFIGCENEKTREPGNSQVIQLDQLQPLPPLKTAQVSDSLKVAVAAILSPQGTIQSYQPFLRVLESKTGKEVVLIQRKTYQEVNNMLIRSVVDVAFVCTGAYVKQKEHMELLAIPQINGKKTYRSLLIAGSSSNVSRLEDLRGKVFAFTDPLSNTGYRYPLSLLTLLKETPESFFSRTLFTFSHDRSIDSVKDGIANGAAVDSIVYEFFKKRDPLVASKTKVIKASQEFGMPPVVVPKTTSAEQKEWLQNLFLDIHNDPAGKQALDVMGVDQFVMPDPDQYHFQ